MVGHEMTLDEAVDLVAREVFARGDERSWEHYPEIGEHDWDRVLTRVAELMPVPDVAEFAAAYAFLTARAEADTDACCEPTPKPQAVRWKSDKPVTVPADVKVYFDEDGVEMGPWGGGEENHA